MERDYPVYNLGIHGDIVPFVMVRGLGFFYSPAVPILRDISVLILANESVALVGLTGSGKTTLLDVLAGLRTPPRGQVHIVGSVGYATQEPILMYGTVAENIAYGVSGHIGLIPGWMMPFDLDRNVGESGMALSGGQRQLVATSRLACRDADVWLLDEPTSALDAETEAKVMEWLLPLKANKVLVMATHKLSLASRFDRILVLHNGRIVQDGTHEKLVWEDGLYQRLWKLQEVAG